MEEIIVNSEKYVPADFVKIAKIDGKRFCLVCTKKSNTYVGYIKSRKGKEVTLSGACELFINFPSPYEELIVLSNIAVYGVEEGTPEYVEYQCSDFIPGLILTDVVKIIPFTKHAANVFFGRGHSEHIDKKNEYPEWWNDEWLNL